MWNLCPCCHNPEDPDYAVNRDIGEWGAHEEAMGTSFLKGSAVSGEDARAIMRTLGASKYTMFKTLSDVGMDERSRTAIIEHVDMFHAENAIEEADLILPLSHAQLLVLVGEEVVGRLEVIFGRFGCDDYNMVVRRVEPVGNGRCINFHTDVTRRTMQVVLNDESEYDGGRLVYATDEGLLWPNRKAGSAILHDDSIAHGVSMHLRDVRYGLFFLQAPDSIGCVHGLVDEVDETHEEQPLIHLKGG